MLGVITTYNLNIKVRINRWCEGRSFGATDHRHWQHTAAVMRGSALTRKKKENGQLALIIAKLSINAENSPLKNKEGGQIFPQFQNKCWKKSR